MAKGTWQIYSIKDIEMGNYPDFLGDSTESPRILKGRMQEVRVREGDMTTEAENCEVGAHAHGG